MAVTLSDIKANFPEFDLGTFDLTFTADASTDVLTSASHGLQNDQTVRVANTGGALPGGLSAAVAYYVVTPTASTLKLSLSSGGAPVDITSAGSGTNKLSPAADALITLKLAEAIAQIDTSLFELATNADSAVKYLTAHLLALSPAGMNMKLTKAGTQDTIYWATYVRLVRAASAGFRAT